MTLTHLDVFAAISVILMVVTLFVYLKDCPISHTSPISELPYAMVSRPSPRGRAIANEIESYSKFTNHDPVVTALVIAERDGLLSGASDSRGMVQDLDIESTSSFQCRPHNLIQVAEHEQPHAETLGRVPVESESDESFRLENTRLGLHSDKSVPKILALTALHPPRLPDEAPTAPMTDQVQTVNEPWTRQKPDGDRHSQADLVQQPDNSVPDSTPSSPPSSSSQFRVSVDGSELMPLFATNVEWDILDVGSWIENQVPELEHSVMDFLQE